MAKTKRRLVVVRASACMVLSMILTRGALLSMLGAVLGLQVGVVISLGQDIESTVRVLPTVDLAATTVATSTLRFAVGALPAAGLAAIQAHVKALQDA